MSIYSKSISAFFLCFDSTYASMREKLETIAARFGRESVPGIVNSVILEDLRLFEVLARNYSSFVSLQRTAVMGRNHRSEVFSHISEYAFCMIRSWLKCNPSQMISYCPNTEVVEKYLPVEKLQCCLLSSLIYDSIIFWCDISECEMMNVKDILDEKLSEIRAILDLRLSVSGIDGRFLIEEKDLEVVNGHLQTLTAAVESAAKLCPKRDRTIIDR